MKKIRLAGLALAAPLCLLCACTTQSSLSFSANWYSDTALIENISDTYEHLEYAVTFRGSEDETHSVDYDDGIYTTTLRSKLYKLPDGTSETVYVYSTELSITGRYTYNGETSETFEDSVTSEVVFRNIKNRLAPVHSLKTVKSTSPVTNPDSLENSFLEYRYTYEVSYDVNLTQATVVYTDLAAENAEPKETVIPISVQGSYLDNEQILFALRGLDLSMEASFSSINPVGTKVESLSVASPASTTVSLKNADLNGTVKDYEIDAYSVTLYYNSTLAGSAQTLYYAQTVPSSNTYRNALLYMEVPVMNEMGTLCYSLVKAQFTSK